MTVSASRLKGLITEGERALGRSDDLTHQKRGLLSHYIEYIRRVFSEVDEGEPIFLATTEALQGNPFRFYLFPAEGKILSFFCVRRWMIEDPGPNEVWDPVKRRNDGKEVQVSAFCDQLSKWGFDPESDMIDQLRMTLIKQLEGSKPEQQPNPK